MKLQDIFDLSVENINGPFCYRIYNDLNNECYIGQTAKSLYSRFVLDTRSSHKSRYLNKLNNKLYNAIWNLGLNHFYVEIIKLTDNLTLDELEVNLIHKYDSCNNGYNDTKGGKSFSVNAIYLAYKALCKHCKEAETGCFYNKDLHKISATKGGYFKNYRSIIKVINLLKELNLDLNEENYNKYKSQISHNVSKYHKAIEKYPELFNSSSTTIS